MNVSFVKNTSKITSKNIVVYLSPDDTVSLLDFLELPQNIVENIQSNRDKKESNMSTYFLGKKPYETLHVFVDKEEVYNDSVNFLGKHLPNLPDSLAIIASSLEKTQMLLEVSELSRYSFQKYKSKQKKRSTQVYAPDGNEKTLKDTIKKIENIYLSRDLGETPACDLTPKAFATIVEKTKFSRVKVTVLDYKDLKKQGFGLIDAVGKGSINPPCVVVLEHIVDKKGPVFGLVGKGITFDTGGNQLKPDNFMYDMKGDMGGASVVYALMKELDRKKVKKNVVACLVLAENVVSANAYKPSDILSSYSGKTVEVIHTDAEGRLVLADGMSYLGKKYNTSSMMTIATLTGACIVALGYRNAGVMGTDRKTIDAILEYSRNHSEKYVELPLEKYMIEKTKSDIADYKNLDRGVHAGSSMGAAFLSNFLENNEAYTHIDIAGTYINEGDPYGKMPKGMTGFGVESLSDILFEDPS